MKKNFKCKKIIKLLIAILIGIYVICVFINQQKTLNSYKASQDYYAMQITKQENYKDTLINLENNINSQEYIEEIAREKLDMYLPNERVYIDIGQ